MTAFQLYILLIAQFFAIYGIDSLSDAEKKESIKDLGAALEIQYNGSYLKKVKSFTELDPAFQELCIQWHDAFDKIKELLYIWQILRFAILEKKELEKDFTNANELKNFIEYKPEDQIIELETDPSHLLTFRPKFFQKMEKGGQILTISEAMKAIQMASRAFFISEKAQECPTFIEFDGQWQKQVDSWEEWHKQNIKKMPRMAKADMVIHHALTNARKRVSKRLR
uniref:Uncharacterized protein n=1 Tax=Globodera rostochiensis TaxID=31243 RepID=A0A914GS07_GLORO